MIRIAIVYNMLTPFMHPVFGRIAERDDVELLVVYETRVEANRVWSIDGALPYRYVVLDSWSFDVSSLVVGSGMRVVSDHYLHVPRHPLRALVDFSPDAVVAAGGGMWASPANNAALAARRRHGWAWIPRWESFPRPRPTVPRRIAEPWVRTFMRSGDAWIAIGTRSARDLARLGAVPSRISLAPVVAEPAATNEVARPRARRRFLFVGQLIERKGLEILLRAWRDVDGELAVAGDGVLRPAVEAAAAADRRIRYAGHADGAELEELFAWADVLVLPSLYEVWGVVVNEALSRGLVVVASDQVGAVDDLVTEGVNGLVVRAGSSEDLRRALRDVSGWPAAHWDRARALSHRLLDGALDRAAEGYVQACLVGADHRRSRTGRRANG